MTMVTVEEHRTVRTLDLPNYGIKKEVVFPDKSRGEQLRTGSFSAVERVNWDGRWMAAGFQYCREYFQDDSWGLRRMLFVHRPCKSKHIAAFMDRIEEKLDIEPRSHFGPSQRYNIMWLMPSRWWMDSEMKRSLFTALLRCGWSYDPLKDNFEEALWSIRYTKETKYAVRRFLSGHTRYMGKGQVCYIDNDLDTRVGWYDEFRWGRQGILDGKPRTRQEINRLLRRPDLSDSPK